MKPAQSSFRAAMAIAFIGLASFAAQAQDDDKKMRPICKMSDSDVHLTADGWAGPRCITADASGSPVASSLEAEKARVAKANAGPNRNRNNAPPADEKPLCKMSDSGVTLTSRGGWAGPNCIEADSMGRKI